MDCTGTKGSNSFVAPVSMARSFNNYFDIKKCELTTNPSYKFCRQLAIVR